MKHIRRALLISAAVLFFHAPEWSIEKANAQAPGPLILNPQWQGHPTALPPPVAGGVSNLPTVASCGTGAVSNGATDFAGQAVATGATACTVTFALAWGASPFCVVTDYTTAAALKTVITGTTMAVTGLTSGDTFGWICIGRTGAP